MPAPLNNTNATKSWDDERDAALKACLADKMTFEQTAADLNHRFGTAFTRSAIGGRAMRLNLRSLNPACVRPGAPLTRTEQLAKKAAAARVRRGGQAEKVIAMPRIVPPDPWLSQPLRCDEVVPMNVTLLDLDLNGCRWPYGQGVATTFCNHLQQWGSAYCPHHRELSIGVGTPSEKRAHHVTDRVLT
jgi:GcrA cell cycle regulator